ncbi:MAG: DUF296 domain-containing protein [Candidatus Omnitrophica bacterium]|nr:DUF296 domain-containing protein [Candidatus Omnitrophota bacterium]
MQLKQGRIFMGRLKHRSDLLEELTSLCKKEDIRLGVFSVIGALDSVKLGYYKQNEQEYTECASLDKKLEITSCTGNISDKDGEVFVHAHITLADHKGSCYGGHLMPEARIFAGEYYIKELTGGKLSREFDQETGLSLWR